MCAAICIMPGVKANGAGAGGGAANWLMPAIVGVTPGVIAMGDGEAITPGVAGAGPVAVCTGGGGGAPLEALDAPPGTVAVPGRAAGDGGGAPDETFA